jgi:hypothetical protein
MAKLLKDILKQAHDTIKGVRPSTTVDGSIGKDPGVDYDPKAGDEQDFVAKHSVQKWDDPNGNSTGVFTSQKGEAPYQKQSKGVYESKKDEDTKCNMSEAGSWCPMHEMADCSKMTKINEISKSTLGSYIKKSSQDLKNIEAGREKNAGYAAHVKTNRMQTNRTKGINRAVNKLAKEEVEQIDELSSATYKSAMHKASNRAMWDPQGPKGPMYKKYKTMAQKFRDKGMDQEKKEKASMKEEVELDEVSKATLGSYVNKADDSVRALSRKTVVGNASPEQKKKFYDNNDRKIDKRFDSMDLAIKKLSGKAKVNAKEEVELDEVITKKTSAGEVISDFIHSKNPKFAGKSKEERKRMALGAYYSKHPEKSKSVKEDLAVPLLGGEPPRGHSDEAAEMVKSELKALANKAMHLISQMPDSMHVEPWIQAKIAQAKEHVSAVHDYMIYGDHDKQDEKEQMDTPMTFPNMSVDVNTGRNV